MSQALMDEEDFAFLGGTTPTLYWRHSLWELPTTQDADYAWAFVDRSTIYDGHRVGTIPNAVPTVATQEYGTDPVPLDQFPHVAAFSLRRGWTTTPAGQARAHFEPVFSGAPFDQAARYLGVYGRAAVGAFLNQGDIDQERVTGTQAYLWVRLAKASAGGVKYRLIRWESSTYTVLGEFPASPSKFLPMTESAGAVTLRMTITDEGPNVRVRGYATRFGGSLIGSAVHEEELLVEVVDTTPGGLASGPSGGYGFLASVEAYDSQPVPNGTANRVQFFEFTNLNTGDVERDEFARTNRLLARRAQGFRSTPGRSLCGAWSSDLFGMSDLQTGGVHDGGTIEVLQNRTTAPTLVGEFSEGVQQATDGVVFNVRQVPVASATQSRKLTVEFLSSGTGDPGWPRYLGVILRANGGSDTNAFTMLGTAYVCALRYRESVAKFDAALFRVHFDSPSPELVDVIGYVGDVGGLALDTQAELQFAAEQVDGPAGPDQTVLLKAWIDDVEIEFGPGTDWEEDWGALDLWSYRLSTAGIEIQGDGTIRDSSSDRILNGTGTGIYSVTRLLGTTFGRPLRVRAWEYGDVQAPGPGESIPEQDQATIAIGSECDSAPVTRLEVPIGWDVSKRRIRLERRLELGAAPYRSVHLASPYLRPVWTITTRGATDAEVAALLAHWDAHDRHLPFLWLDDRGTDQVVKFRSRVRDAILPSGSTRRASEFSFELIGVRCAS